MKFDDFKLSGERNHFQRLEGAFQQIAVAASLAGYGIWIYITGSDLKNPNHPAAWVLTGLFSLHVLMLFVMRAFREKWRDIEKHAESDAVTGIMNRECFERMLEGDLRRSGRYRYPVSLCILDLDHFTSYNEQYGREKADHLLKSFAEFLVGNIRFADCAARLEKDEFILCLPHTDLVGAHKFVKRFLIQCEERLDCGFSAGITAYQPGEKRSQFVLRVQAALHQAKRTGRKQIHSIAAGKDSQTVLSF